MDYRRVRARPGVSEVVGALLLIIVVVTAVASLSYFLANASQNAENRSNYLTDLKNENFQVVYASFSQAWLSGNTTAATPTVLTELPNMWPPNQYVGYYLEYTSGPALGQVEQVISNTADTITTVGFNPHPTAGGGDAFTLYGPSQGTWNQVVLSVRNANIVSSGLQDILVNGGYITKWFQVNAPGPYGIPASYLGPKNASLLIPAKTTEYIKLNYSAAKPGSLPGLLPANQPLQITLVTQSGNYFRTNWSPPTALATASVSPKAYQAVSQDELSFSGAQSYADNGTVVGYSWAISVPSSCPSDHSANATATGDSFAYAPEALFPTSSAAPYTCDSITGPVTATLTVTDSNGFQATSQPIIVPPDPALDPPASLTFVSESSTGPYNIIVRVNDAYGSPLAGEVVTAVTSGGLSIPISTVTTDASGQATFVVSSTSIAGSAVFQGGGLPPLDVSYP